MTSALRPVARHVLARWHGATNNPDSPFWDSPVNWEQEPFVSQVIERLSDEIGSRWSTPADHLTAFGKLVIEDILPIERQPHSPAAFLGIEFIRFLVASSATRHAVQQGRSSIAYNWYLCTISERAYQDAMPGEPIEVEFRLDRPELFLLSSFDCVRGYAPLAVIQWFGDLYYIAWKFSMHHGLAGHLRGDARRILSALIRSDDSDAIRLALEAAAHIPAWLNQSDDASEARAIAGVMEWAFNNSAIPPLAKKSAGMALATQIGIYTSDPPATWARRVLRARKLIIVTNDAHCVTLSVWAQQKNLSRNTACCFRT